MDLLARTVTRAGQQIDLQPREFRLLEFLMRHAGQVVTRTMLLENVWDYHFDPQTNVIDVHVSRLRAEDRQGISRCRSCTRCAAPDTCLRVSPGSFLTTSTFRLSMLYIAVFSPLPVASSSASSYYGDVDLSGERSARTDRRAETRRAGGQVRADGLAGLVSVIEKRSHQWATASI